MTAATTAVAPAVIKGENDPRHYRHLALSNGLTVLLIHDPEMNTPAGVPASSP